MKPSVVAYWRVAAAPGVVCEEFFGIVNLSYTDEEFADLLARSANASIHGF